MDDCMFKPISLTLLSKRLNELKPASSEVAFNIESLYALSGSDPVRVKRLLEEILRSNRIDLEELQKLTTKDGLAPFSELAHRIKGAARIVSAHLLIAQCEALEKADLSTVHHCCKQVIDAMASMEQTLLTELEKLNH